MRHIPFRAFIVAGAVASVVLPGRVAQAADPVTLTLYSAQHAQTVRLITDAFTKQTGIKVQVHKGEAPEIANQLAQEGSASPADVYFTENSPELTLLNGKDLLVKLEPSTLQQVPPEYSAPNGHWVGVLARENVLAFNPDQVAEKDLPASLLDLAKPEWKGRIAIAPADADFLPLVTVISVLKGRPAALEWLKGLKENALLFNDDEAVVAAVERGATATGLINNYYWARLATELGADKTKSRIYHFTNGDAGGLINVSGAAVMKASKHPAEAQSLVAFMVSPDTQKMLAESNVDYEYPLARDVSPNALLKPFDELQPPKLSITQLGDDQDAAALLRDAGLL